jgi:hypothetical protein
MHGSTGGSWKRSTLTMATEVAPPTGKPAERRPRDLPSATTTAPAPDPTILGSGRSHDYFTKMTLFSGEPRTLRSR